MIRIGSIHQSEIKDIAISNVTCPRCNAVVNADLNRSVQTGTILCIPFIKMSVLYYSVCPNCGMKYILNKKDYDRILHSSLTSSSNEWNIVCGCILENQREKSNNSVMRSKKNVFLASMLSLIFNLIGLQNLYMGHKKRFLINVLFFIISIFAFALALIFKIQVLSYPCALLLATNIYWGIIDFIRILSGHAKDSNGAYLLTNIQYKKRLWKCQDMCSRIV